MTRVLQSPWVVPAVTFLLLLGVAGRGVRQWLHYERIITIPRSFKPEIWAGVGSRQERNRERWAMWDDLRTNHLRIGMSETQIQSLLGRADRTNKQIRVYRIGREAFTRRELVLRFDGNAHLSRIEMQSDD